LQATIWSNPTENGNRYNVTLRRSYQQDDEWKETKVSLPFSDLLQAARLLEWANDRIFEDIGQQKFLREQHGDDGTNGFVSQATEEFAGSVVTSDDIPF
jgi:hypothetical protein